MRIKEYRYMKEIKTVKILGIPNFSIPLINWGKEVVEESKMMENNPKQDLTTTFHKIQRPLWDTESPLSPKLYPPPIASFFMKGIEILTRKRKGRMTRIFFVRWPKGSFARRATPISVAAKRPKRKKALGGQLTPTNMRVKKTRIFALASRWWIGLSIPLW
jgi:hypothetical protein